MRRVWPLAFLTGCFGGNGCPGPTPTPLPDTVAGPASTLQASVRGGWRVMDYEGVMIPNAVLEPLQDRSLLPELNSTMDRLLGELTNVMIIPGFGQGGGGSAFRQPTMYDTTKAEWDQNGFALVLQLAGDPVAWGLTYGQTSVASGEAASSGAATHTLHADFAALEQAEPDLPVATGTVDATYVPTAAVNANGTICMSYIPTVTLVYHANGTDETFSGGQVCSDTLTSFETDANGLHYQVKMRWDYQLDGRADGTITGGTAPVHATECWTGGNGTYTVTYYHDDGGLHPDIGTDPGVCLDPAP